ncbi:type VII secretion protein EccCa [Kineococcus sp. T13]|nr:type VII secretion protein EccCa [Kineococcus vitellinus]
MDAAPVRLSPPPPLADPAAGTSWTYALFPLLGSGGMMVVALMRGNPLFVLTAAVFMLGSLAMGLAMWLQARSRAGSQSFDARIRYLQHLDEARTQLQSNADAQRAAAQLQHPQPASTSAAVLGAGRLWERRRDDEDFLLVRIGSARVPALHLPQLPAEDVNRPADPSCQQAVQLLLAAHARVEQVPVAISLRSGVSTLVGSPERTRASARALLAGVVALHAPQDVRIAVCAPSGALEEWEWLKWLPHTQHPAAGADGGPQLLLAADAGDLALMLQPELRRRRARSPRRAGTGAGGTTAGNSPLNGAGGGASGGAESSQGATSFTGTTADEDPHLIIVIDGRVGEDDPFAEADLPGVAQLRLLPFTHDEPAEVDLSLRLGRPQAGAVLIDPVVRATGHTMGSGAGGGAGGGVGSGVGRGAGGQGGQPASWLQQAEQLHADSLSVPEVEVLARRLAPLQVDPASETASLAQVNSLPELLGIEDVATFEPHRVWAGRSEADLLRVPLGIDADGRPLQLDLKESAQSGMGPHGLVVGATGSGKSELLRTLVTALALTHSPDDLALVLVDFKGGATFAGLAGLPHLAGSLTDLEDDPATIDRFAETLRGEMRRREEVLRDAGNLASIREHRQRRLAGQGLEAMPHLLVVVDEFSELLAQKPEFIDLFVMIGRLGRSLGVHLLLSTQRLEEGRLRGLDSHLSYRLALRTFSAAESRAVIGTADAFELPPTPGSAYLKVDTTIYQRLRAATVSTAYRPPRQVETAPVPVLAHPRRFEAFAPAGLAAALPVIEVEAGGPVRRSVLQVAVERLSCTVSSTADGNSISGGANGDGRGGRGAGPVVRPVRPVWLPPLPTKVPLGACLTPQRPAAGAFDGTPAVPGTLALAPAPLRVPIGLIDLPQRQQQGVYALDLSVAGGHIGIAGAPQSGKSTLLRTLITSLACTHTPAQVQVYCLDLAGGALKELQALPHVGVVATRQQPQLVRRTIAQLNALVDERERRLTAAGVDSFTGLRRQQFSHEAAADPTAGPLAGPTAGRAAHPAGAAAGPGTDRAAGGSAGGFSGGSAGGPAGGFAQDADADVFLVVDGWSVLRAEFEDLEQAVTALATRGAAYGVHVVISTTRWFDLRPAVRDALGTKLELRLGDPAETYGDRKAAKAMPTDIPGRLLLSGGQHVQVAAPLLLAPTPTSTAAGQAAQLEPFTASAERITRAWGGPPAPPVQLLPTLVRLRALPSARLEATTSPSPHSGSVPTAPAAGGTSGTAAEAPLSTALSARPVAVGVRERDLAPAHLDLIDARDPHLLVVGEAGAGKTNALRTLVRQVTRAYSPEELLVVVIDYRRGLLDAVDEAHLSRYCASAPVAAATLTSLAHKLAERLPGPDVTRQQLKSRTWWSGPRAMVIMDDHDLASSSSGDPLSELLELLPVARDVGLHVVLAQAAGGVGGAMMQPVLRRLRELGSQALLLSGPGEEGAIVHNTRLQALPVGRAVHVSRGSEAQVVQLALSEDGGSEGSSEGSSEDGGTGALW